MPQQEIQDDEEDSAQVDNTPQTGGVEEAKEGREQGSRKEIKVGGLALCMAYNKVDTFLKDPEGRRLRDAIRLIAFEDHHELEVSNYAELVSLGWIPTHPRTSD